MKKTLSIIFAAAMVLALLPTGLVSANSNATDGYNYVFTKEALNSTSNVQMATLAEMKLDDVLAEKSDPWRAAANLYLYNAYVNENGFYWNAYNVRATTGEGCFGIELSVPEGGTFVPSLTYTTLPSGPIVDVYLVKEDVISSNVKTADFTFAANGNGNTGIYYFTRSLGDEHKLAQLDMYSDTQKSKTVTFAERTLDSNSKYYLLFRTVGTNEKYAGLSDKYLEVMLKSFSLTPPPENYTYNFTKEALNSTSNVQMATLAEMKLDDVLAEKSDPWRAAANLYLYNAYVNENGFYWNAYNVRTTTGEGCFGIELSVPEGGTFVPSLTYTTQPSGPIVDAYLVKEDVISSNVKTADFTFAANGNGNTGIYYFTRSLGDEHKLAQLDMYSDTQKTKTVTFAERTLDSNSKYYLLFRTVGTNENYKGLSDKYLEVMLKSFSFTPPVQEDPIPTEEFNAVEDKTTITSYEVGTVEAVAYTIGTNEQDSTISVEAKDNEDGTYTLNAPEYEDYNFLYWKKGLTEKKDVITYKPTGFVYAPTAGENNIVIAVYEKDGESTTAKAEFYNANGQFIASTDGSFPTDIPSMAGYGDATGWQCYTDGKTYGLDESVTPNGIMLFVADYEDTPDTVKVNGEDVPYGTEITFTAKPATGKKFKCWTRTDEDKNTEIVSIEENYTFCAYEDCTITEVDTEGAVVSPANTRKIVLDTFSAGSATALMAEFIGFKNDTVVEKGIMFENNRIAMKSTGTQFTIIPDEEGTYKGYAVIKNTDDNGYTLITDGEYGK